MAAPPEPPGAGVAEQTVAGDQVRTALDYWTPQRMADAVPAAPDTVSGAGLSAAAVSASATTTDPVPDGLYSQLPYRATGKVYFTDSVEGINYVCSGAAVGGRVVLTAGHCVSNGAGTFHRNWLFVPAYDRGLMPYGRWAALRLLSFNTWHTQSDRCRDVGFAVVGNVAGQILEARLAGTLHLTTNQSPTRTWQLLGYPRFPSQLFDGEYMVRTTADLEGFFTQLGCATPVPPLCVRSDMGPGVSGGPWLMEQNGTAVSGASSFIFPSGSPPLLCSPRFDSAVGALYAQALNVTIYAAYLPVIRH